MQQKSKVPFFPFKWFYNVFGKLNPIFKKIISLLFEKGM